MADVRYNIRWHAETGQDLHSVAVHVQARVVECYLHLSEDLGKVHISLFEQPFQDVHYLKSNVRDIPLTPHLYMSACDAPKTENVESENQNTNTI